MIFLKEYILKYIKILPIPLISIIIMSLTFSITNLLNYKTNNIIILIIMILVMLISGYILSNNITKKKYLHGLIFGIITTLILFIISIIYKPTYTYNTLIYYILLILSSMIGAMISTIKK